MKIIVSNNQEIYGLSQSQRALLKDSLTFDNPAYKNAKRYGRSRYISIPPYLMYYGEKSVRADEGVRKKVMTVPSGVKVSEILNLPFIDIEDNRNECEVKFPKFRLELRDAQKEAEKAYLANEDSNIVQLPTGKGKSILALHIAQTLGQKTLILVHKDDLVVGWKKDIKLCFGDIDVGLIKAKSRKVGKQITIATVQTLNRMSAEELKTYTQEFGLVVQDECLVGNTLVVLEDGRVTPIMNIVNGKNVLGGKVSNRFSRESEIWELESSHSILKGSPTHPTWCIKKSHNGHTVYTEDDFIEKPIKDLTSDYMIPIKVKIPHTVKNTTSEDLARFIALIQCDGHLDSTSRRVKVNVQKYRKYYYDVFSKGCEEFNAEIKFSNDNRENVTYWTTDKKVRLYLEDIVPSGKKSNLIKVPHFMYSAPIESVKAYIETCFNCEGDLSVGSSNRIHFSTCSEDFAQGLSLLLKKFGILCNIQHIRRGNNHNDVYRLSVSGIFFNMFMNTFNLIDRKMTLNRNNGNKNKNHFVGDYYLSDVKCSSPCGYKDTVYDFTVEETHSFIANGVFTHNCHHIGLNIFNVIDKFNSRYKLGLSATPKRSDGLDFVFDIFLGGICYKYEADESDEDISQVEVRVIDSPFKYKPFSVKGQVFNYYDFKPQELPDKIQFVEEMPYEQRPRIPYLTIDNEAVLNELTGTKVCSKIIEEYNKGHSILALFTQKEHINAYYQYLCGFIPEDKIMLYYGDSKESSASMMKKAEDKEVLVTLATYAKATEGTNVKSWEVLFLVSSLNNKKNVEQATGRIRRKKEGKLNPVIVYDVRYNNCYSLRSHYSTRLSAYNKLKYKVADKGNKSSMFTRGYN